VKREGLSVLARLGHHEEKRARLALAQATEEAAAAQAALGPAPQPVPPSLASDLEAFLVARASSHLAWAAWGARLGRTEEALGRQQAARLAWSKAASDLKAIERLLARRAQRAEMEAALATQRELDEVAIRQWRRSCHAAASRP
jgi:hypothetical protein